MEANAFIVIYMANYYWKVRKDLNMARSVFTSNKDRCQKSLPFWKFFMNFLYSTAENPSEELLALRNDCMNSALDYNAKLEMYQLFIQYYSTICEDVANLKQMKLDYSIWKLAVSAEKMEEEQRASQKRESGEMAAQTATQQPVQQVQQPVQQVQQVQQPVQQPMQPVQQPIQQPMQQPMMQMPQQMPQMGAVPTDPNSPEYAQYYYQYYQYYGMNYGAQQPAPTKYDCLLETEKRFDIVRERISSLAFTMLSCSR